MTTIFVLFFAAWFCVRLYTTWVEGRRSEKYADWVLLVWYASVAGIWIALMAGLAGCDTVLDKIGATGLLALFAHHKYGYYVGAALGVFLIVAGIING